MQRSTDGGIVFADDLAVPLEKTHELHGRMRISVEDTLAV